MFALQAYKRWGGEDGFSPFPSSSPFISLYNSTTIDMSSPSPAYTSFPFSFKEDAMAPDVVESMEQVGDLASLSLN